MEGVSHIFQGIINAEEADQEIYLQAIDEHQSFYFENPHGTNILVQDITSALSKPDTRRRGLTFLNRYLEQCPIEIFEKKAIVWLTLTLKACNSKEARNVGYVLYIALKNLALKSFEVSEVSKAFQANFLPKIYASLSTADPVSYHTALQCVETCLRLYPSQSGPSRNAIEAFVVKFIDSRDQQLVIWSGKCFHILQQIRGGSEPGFNHTKSWQIYQQQLLGSLHSLLDLIFTNCQETYEDPKETLQLSISPIQLSDSPTRRVLQLSIRFKALIQYLISALRDDSPIPKRVMPKKILNLISRGLSVTIPTVEKNLVFSNATLVLLLPMIHRELFKLLETSILLLKSHLAMFHSIILGLILDTLKWTSAKRSARQPKPYPTIRAAAYEALRIWCNALKHGSKSETIAEALIAEIAYDITPFKNTFILKINSGSKKHMSKKARRQLHKAQNEQSNLAQIHSNPRDLQIRKVIFSEESDQKLCVAALQCLSSVFQSAGSFLKPNVVKTTHLKIIDICLSLSEDTPKPGHLYNQSLCRLGVYNALQTLIFASHHLCPPPTAMAMKLLQIAKLKDENQHVREACSLFINNLEKVIHPQKESLVFPSDIREIRNAFHKLGKEQLLINEVNEISDSDDDDSSDEENAAKDDETAAPAPGANSPIQSIDLTVDDNDSVEFVPRDLRPEQSNTIDTTGAEAFDATKSPEMNLRVEEDDEDDALIIPGVVDNAIEVQSQNTNEPQQDPSHETGQAEDGAPSAKKPRLEESVPENDGTAENEQANGGTGDKDIVSFEEIAAAFVDELI